MLGLRCGSGDEGVGCVQRWVEIINQARQSVEYLKAVEVVRAVLNILQVCLVEPWERWAVLGVVRKSGEGAAC